MFSKLIHGKTINFGKLVNAAAQKVLTEHEFLTRASAIAFDALLAFIPTVTLFAIIAAKLLPSLADPTNGGATAQEVQHFLHTIFPSAAATIIQGQIVFMQSLPSFEVLTVVCVLSLYLGSGFFSELINAINHIYELEETRSFLQVRFVTLKLIALNTLTIMGTIILITVGPWIFQLLGSSELMGFIINWSAVFFMILLGFGLTFKLAPCERQRFTLISPGAFVGAVLSMTAGYCFRLWVTHVAHYEILYGTLGSFMMLLVWSYLMSSVFLMATEMNKLARYAAEMSNQPEEKPSDPSQTGANLGTVNAIVEKKPDDKVGGDTDNPGH